MKIHPSAIVHPEARIAADVEIGPGVVIESPAVIGAGCVLLAHAVLTGEVTLGKNNRIGYGAILGAPAQDLSSGPDTRSQLILGDGNTVREYCTLHRGAKEGSVTRVGDGNLLMAGAHVGHNATVGNGVIIANNVLLGGHVVVGDGVFLGGASVFHQHIHVGRRAISQGNSAFSKDLPPYMVGTGVNQVAGLNILGMRRAGLTPAQRSEVKEAFKLVYKSGLNLRQALERAAGREWGENARAFLDFVAASGKRGISALGARKRTQTGPEEAEA